MTNLTRSATFAFGLLLAMSGQAFAHAMLESAVPKAGSTVAKADEIRLGFSEAIEPRFSTITVTNDAGKQVVGSRATVDPTDAKTLLLRPPGALPPGHYHIDWSVVSVDTHRTQGGFDFTVKP
jgi:methionine-rich copper-binding protein CopC